MMCNSYPSMKIAKRISPCSSGLPLSPSLSWVPTSPLNPPFRHTLLGRWNQTDADSYSDSELLSSFVKGGKQQYLYYWVWWGLNEITYIQWVLNKWQLLLSNQSIFYYLLRAARTFLLSVLRGAVKEGVPHCPQAQHSGTPKFPEWRKPVQCKEKGGSALVGAIATGYGLGKGMCQVIRGREGAVCPDCRIPEGESDVKPALPQGQHGAFHTRVKYRPISIKAPACYYKYLSQFSRVLMWLWCLPSCLRGSVTMVTRPHDQPLFIHRKLQHPGLGVGWWRGLEGGTRRGRMRMNNE